MSKTISTVDLSETLHLSTCTDGIWLYDDTRQMNLSMKAVTPQAAFVEALTYYQERLQEVEVSLARLRKLADVFVSSVAEGNDDA